MPPLRALLSLVALALAGCETTSNQPSAPSRPSATGSAPTSASRSRQVYYFQHRQLRDWVHTTNGRFYENLRAGRLDLLLGSARELLGEEFANAIQVRNLEHPAAALLTFPPPASPPLCHFAAVVKTADGYRYFTLEKSMPLGPDSPKAAFCEWRADGAHALLQFVSTVSEDTFVAALERAANAPAATPAERARSR